MKMPPASMQRTEVSLANKVARGVWGVTCLFLFRPSPRSLHGWRSLLLRLFGAKLGKGVHVYPSARIWAPWNLVMGDESCLADSVICYNVGQVRLGEKATVSQNSHLCTASHDFDDPRHPLVSAAIEIGADAWVAADVFVGPGVQVGVGAVVLARAVVTKDVPSGMVVAGHPAKVLRPRGPGRAAC